MWNLLSRRQFMRYSAGLGLSAAGAAVLERLCLTQAWAQTQTDYKALVCIFLAGGNDGNEIIVPLSGASGFGSADATGGYPAYFTERGPFQKNNGLAIADPNGGGASTAFPALVAVNPNVTGLGTFGMNPNLNTSFASVNGTVTLNMPSFQSLYSATTN